MFYKGFVEVLSCGKLENAMAKMSFWAYTFLVFEERESPLQNAYKHIAFPMDFNAFWRKGIQDDQ